MKGCVPTWCGSIPEPSSCPPQLSVDLATFQHCTGCLLCTIVVYNEDAYSVTCGLFSRPPAVAVHVSFSCLPGFMKAALICLTLLLSYATLTGGVEMWGWDESFIYSVANAVAENSFNKSSIWVRWCGRCLSHVLKFWSDVALMVDQQLVLFPCVQLNLSRSDPVRCLPPAVSLLPGSK